MIDNAEKEPTNRAGADAMVDVAHDASSSADKWNRAWGALFGINSPVQVFFPDNELNARVYTLDGDTGYQVQHKKVFGNNPSPPRGILDETERLTYPKKARRGESHGRSRLESKQVLAIRRWAKELTDKGEALLWTNKVTELKSEGIIVSEGTLRDIVARRTWGHV